MKKQRKRETKAKSHKSDDATRHLLYKEKVIRDTSFINCKRLEAFNDILLLPEVAYPPVLSSTDLSIFV